MASVIHGFFYNKKIFSELGLTVPQTREAFFAVLDKVKADGRYVPLAVSGSESWVASELGFQNIGPNYWKGEDGRLALIGARSASTTRNTSRCSRSWPAGVTTWGGARAATSHHQPARLPSMRRDPGDRPLHRQGGLRCHAPARGKAGGWLFLHRSHRHRYGDESGQQEQGGRHDLPAVADHPQFAELYTNSLPGFFSLSNHFFEATNPAAREMMEWRDQCDSTIRVATQILSAALPSSGMNWPR
jgi:raffinose/stachyose/melibiose transport system substrate-binding protein